MKRLLSVIIPSYNHARFIAEAIESVAAQRHENLELVVVDDGSTDESVEVIRSVLAEVDIPHVQLIEQENRGAPAAIDRGVQASAGEWLSILNSDDTFHPERFSRIREEVPEEGDFFAFSMVRMVDHERRPLPDSSETVAGYQHALYEASQCPTIGYALLRNNFSVTSGNFVFTRALYDKLGGFGNYELAHDWDFLLRALYHVEPIFVTKRLLDYRTHAHNTRHGLQDQSLVEGRRILNDYLALCANSPPPNTLAPCEENWPVYFDLFSARHESWFDRAPIRSHLDRPPTGKSATDDSPWRKWSAAIDFHDVEGRSYFSGANASASDLEALALMRQLVLDAADPVASEYGSGPNPLQEVAKRQLGHPLPSKDEAWLSPFFGSPVGPPGPGNAPGENRVARAAAAFRRLREDIGKLPSLFSALSLKPSEWRSRSSEWRAIRKIRRSGSFELSFYRNQTRSSFLSDEEEAIRHYLRLGADHGLDPHPFFSSRFYLEANPDIARAGINPLLHYLQHGIFELRPPHPQFDPEFYRRRFDPILDQNENLIVHYLKIGKKQNILTNETAAIRDSYRQAEVPDGEMHAGNRFIRGRRLGRLRRTSLFDEKFYLAQAAEKFSTIGDPARHFAEEGSLEGLNFVPSEQLEEEIWKLDAHSGRPEFAYLETRGASPDEVLPKPVAESSVAIYSSSLGNAFHHEMAKLLAHGFRATGAEVSLRDENDPADTGATHSIVVAPHEFFGLGEGATRCTPEFLPACHLFLAEQPGSRYFSMCLWYAQRALGVLDINPLSALVWSELGIEARALPLGYIEGYPAYEEGVDFSDSLAWASLEPAARDWKGRLGDPLLERPIDVFFNGVLSDRREQFFASNARHLAPHRCALFMPTPSVPIEGNLPSALDERAATALSQRSKIHLNIHRSDFPYFEWHRNVIRSIWQQTLLVTETSYRIPGLEPGEHYIECDLERIPSTINWLLTTSEGRAEAEAVRQSAYKVLRETYPLPRILSAFLRDPVSGVPS